jgi:hypothetical protein
MAKTGPIRTFLNDYGNNIPSTLADCAKKSKSKKMTLREMNLLDNVSRAIKEAYYEFARPKLDETITNGELSVLFVEEMDKLIAAMDI